MPNHVVSTDVPDVVAGRAVLVQRLDMVPVECVARAYLTGGGLREYVADGTVSGLALPDGLRDGDRFEEPLFTPSTKAPMGEHDEPMSYEAVEAEVGPEMAARLRDLTTRILARGNEIAGERGILIADTKVEFGLDASGAIVLADEVLTPDSSRFWPADQWEPGHTQPSLRQGVRPGVAALVGERLGQGLRRGAAGAARRRRRADPGQVRRGLRTPHRPDLLSHGPGRHRTAQAADRG